MSPRELAKVLIRVMGIGFLAFGVLTGCLDDSADLRRTRSSGPRCARSRCSSVGLEFVIAMFLIRQADWLAARFRVGAEPAEGAPAASTGSALDPATLFRVGTGLIGVFCLTRIASPIASIIYQLTRPGPSGSFMDSLSPSRDPGRSVIELVVNLAFAIVLIVGPGRVGRRLARIGRWIRRTFTAYRSPSDAPPAA